MRIVEEEGLVERAERLGNMFRDGLRNLNSPLIKLVRGRGLLNAMIVDETRMNGHSAYDLCLLMKEKHLLVGRCVHVGMEDKKADENDQAKPTHQYMTLSTL